MVNVNLEDTETDLKLKYLTCIVSEKCRRHIFKKKNKRLSITEQQFNHRYKVKEMD